MIGLVWNLVEIRATVIADFFDVIPNIACAEVHPATDGCKFVLTLDLLKQGDEFLQYDPLRRLSAAITSEAAKVAQISLSFVILSFPNRQVRMTFAFRAGIENMNFHSRLHKTKKPTSIEVGWPIVHAICQIQLHKDCILSMMSSRIPIGNRHLESIIRLS